MLTNKKEILKEIIINFQKKALPNVIERNIKLPLNVNKIVSVVGPRRSGKTYLLFETIKKLREIIPSERIVYINFEDERLDLKKDELNLILEGYKELYPKIKLSEVYFFFDEIQNLPAWDLFLKRLFELETKNIYITGSNSRFLSKEIATSLRGRSITYEVFPLNFEEFLRFKNFIWEEKDIYDLEKRNLIKNFFQEYFTWGGYPEIVFLKEEEVKLKILQEYFEVMLFRDLVERYNFKNIPLVKYFLKRIVENVTSPLSINNIYNELKALGYKTSKDTLHKILDAAESVYFIRLLEKYSPSVLKRELSQKKAYIVDNGYITSLSFLNNKSKLLENLVFNELKRIFKDIFYFKNKKECDFIIFNQNKPIPIQVSYVLENERTLKREVEALIKISKYFSINIAYLITYDDENEIKEDDIIVKIIPAWKFLLFLKKYL